MAAALLFRNRGRDRALLFGLSSRSSPPLPFAAARGLVPGGDTSSSQVHHISQLLVNSNAKRDTLAPLMSSQSLVALFKRLKREASAFLLGSSSPPLPLVTSLASCTGPSPNPSSSSFLYHSNRRGQDLTSTRGHSSLFQAQYVKQYMLFHSARTLSSSSQQSSQQTSQEKVGKDISTVEDPFDSPTYHIPEKPVTFTEGASYSIVILAGLGIAGLAAYAVFKELIFEPKEYKIFGKALERVQMDNRVTVRIGSPVTGYGSESRNRAARQRIPNRVWTDEDGVEHVEVNFYIRAPRGAGKVFSEMFKDKADKKWKFTYLIVEITSPSPAQLILESYTGA